jgi:hypothetical protein
MSITLNSDSQLTVYKFLQLGSNEEPCRVRFGLSDKFDADKTWRALKIIPSDADMKILKEFDESHPELSNFVHNLDDGQEFVKVVVSKDIKVIDGCTIADLHADQMCLLIVRPWKWSYKGETGFQLRVAKAKIIDDTDEIDFE